MIKPHHTLLFLLAVAILGFGLMWVTPKGGYNVAGVQIRYPSWDSFWSSDTSRTVDLQAIIRASHMSRLDSAETESEEERKAQEHLKRTLELRRLQFAGTDTVRLSGFKAALEALSGGGRVRILHFGDSQIEGDRITSYLREQWQSRYGGEGPGMLSAMPLAPNFSIRQTQSQNWQRYTAFGKQDTTITHRRFGYRAVISRYTPPILDSASPDSLKAWIEFRPSRQGYRHVRSYHRMRMYFGYHRMPLRMRVLVNDSLYTEEIVQAKDAVLSRTWSFSATPEVIRIEFEGGDSPDVYGISLEGRNGVTADNIPMRGASGVVFTRMSQANLKANIGTEPVHLLLYQYGGNTVPYIRDEDHAKEYAGRVRRQIHRLKELFPDASIVMIGPSDMSEKDGTGFATYDAVPWVRNALRDVAMQEEVGFWDIFGAMGGLNSMPQWVKEEPPLAGADHIHFTPKGARQIASWLYDAFENEMHPPAAEADSLQTDSLTNSQSIQ